jgi:hypothetical protein
MGVKKFVLIGGMPRSGTNLARRIIGSHSKVAIPPGEFKFFSQYANGKSVQEILANKRLEKWNVDFSDLYTCKHRDVFVNTLLRYTERVGKQIPGEKTPLNEFYYDIALEWLSDFDVKFIHLVRNPFDVLASYKHAPFRAKNDRGLDLVSMTALTKKWPRSVTLGLARVYSGPERYILLRYEDLATDPIDATQALCTFLGIDFEQERMLNLSDFSGHADNTSFPQLSEESRRSYGAVQLPQSRKQHLTESEIRIVSSICGELALALGYNDNDFKSSSSESSLGVQAKLKRKLRQLARNYVLRRLT